jgi:ComF family protein
MNWILKTVSYWAAEAVLPPRCPVSGDLVDAHGMVAPQVWQNLDFIIDPMCQKCGMPFGFDADGGGVEGLGDDHLCVNCLSYPPEYHKARSVVHYNDGSKSMILAFKHGDQTHLVRSFIPWIKQAGRKILGDVDVIIPVPLHRWRLLRRRYNQAALIGERLSGETGIYFLVDGLIRKRATPAQGHLTIQERKDNVKEAFTVNPKYAADFKDKNVVLIDDVYTTGATVNECACVLKDAGAARVDVLTLARVVKDGMV